MKMSTKVACCICFIFGLLSAMLFGIFIAKTEANLKTADIDTISFDVPLTDKVEPNYAIYDTESEVD